MRTGAAALKKEEGMIELCVSLLMLMGAALMVISGIGMLRMPDVFCRAHAQTKSMTLGICCMLLAALVYLGPAEVGVKICAAVFTQFATIPVAGHMIALISFRKNVPRYRHREVAYHDKTDALIKKGD